ncbi:NF-kappa-B-repressing factor-like [Armigeres subalbatus]|uniref:NF-kappa-B-repressing factor-like n=1 Tax=Armigeres subalbatus TaxID=124917 RepID=UPI002ED040E2
MSAHINRKRKQPCFIGWKRKIVRQFIEGWIESDNSSALKTAEKDNHAVQKHETLETTELTSSKVNQFSYSNFVKADAEKPVSTVADPGLHNRDAKRLKAVIVYMYNENKISLKMSFEQAGMLFESDYDEKTKIFRYMVNDREICRAEGDHQEAHSKARDRLCEILRFYCYTVKRLKEYHTKRNVFCKIPGEHKSKQHFKDQQLDEANIGFRMMQKQGWAGGSLGNNEDGILEPIGLHKKAGKSGLGAEGQEAEKIPIEAFMIAIKQYASGNALYDLVFSPQFSKHQVIKLKDYASTLKLFPQLIGKRKQLVISKHLTLHQIKEGVQKGHSDLCAKYAVIPPICETHK